MKKQIAVLFVCVVFLLSITACAVLEDKLVDPMIKDADGFRVSDYHEAFMLTAKKCQSIAAKYGKDAVAVAISDRYTNEEAYDLLKELGVPFRK